MSTFHCPNCASPVSPAAASVKLTACESCGTTLFLEDDQARLAGEQGVMHEAPMLFGLGSSIRLGGRTMQILGHARFSYGRGFWEEFWALDDGNSPCWVSLDEGDIVMQRVLRRPEWPKYDGYLKLGGTLNYEGELFTVSEEDDAECVAVRGSFDQALIVGERYRFVNLQGEDGTLLSGEFQGSSREWYRGQWYDPFEVEVLA
ncbi:DUF4178 domain-containing protein [Leisingera sp. ANG-Vp]|uniref:DUF4178 domain-containing protein n=1 Tax=Leisingera sp. ANG-Vp TaxID=1577896 RepID=UPI00057D4CBE|nr:DUF4178 domain-containing protein [Leisingera sp. ANG-Vp]KIC20291.1 hypothetical protein RA20_09865 [Leisingera sp. ANG-Vp]